jgi:hypothetical protein
LIAHWPLDGNTLDASGHGHHGTPSAALEYVDGKVGAAARLDASEVGEPWGHRVAEPCDTFADGVIDPSAWVIGGARRGLGGYGSGSWQWSHAEAEGALRVRVWGPPTGGAYQGEGWVRTRFDYNDGRDHVINFTWEARLWYACHVDAYAIQISTGEVPIAGSYAWFYDDTPGTKNLYLMHSELGGQPACAPGVRIGQVDQPPTQWSIRIDAAARTATLFAGPDLSGTVVGQKSLGPDQPWYVRFIHGDGTSAARPAGDNSLLLHDYCSVETVHRTWWMPSPTPAPARPPTCPWARRPCPAIARRRAWSTMHRRPSPRAQPW